MSDGLIVELAVTDPGGCPVAGVAGGAGEPVTSVSRAAAPDADGLLAEEFALPEGAGPARDGSGNDGGGDDGSGDDGGGDDGALAGAVDADVDRVAAFGGRDVYRFRRDPADRCVCDRLERVVGPVADVHAREGTLFVTVHATDLDTVSAAVTDLRSAFDGVRVTRLRRSADGDEDDLVLVDRAALTDRQREVIETAHELGYFDYPKGANAGDVAGALDISPSTFAEHLAAAQGKLLAAVVEGDR